MAQDHTLMAERYELKYLIRNSLALRIRHFVRQYLELDEYGVGQPNFSYSVHSLYLDSDDWTIYWRTVNGDKNRFKVRVRYYNEDARTPVFFEIKRRMNDIILKQRCGVRRASAASVLAGHLPGSADLVGPREAGDLHAIQDFVRLQHSLQAKPQLHVAYEREAYVNDCNNEVRVTFDRHVRAVLRLDGALATRMEAPLVCTGQGPEDVVILELKFTHRFPNWYRELVRTFDLMQTASAKYLEGRMMYGGRHLHARDVIRNLVL
jgi:hypothetical protein